MWFREDAERDASRWMDRGGMRPGAQVARDINRVTSSRAASLARAHYSFDGVTHMKMILTWNGSETRNLTRTWPETDLRPELNLIWDQNLTWNWPETRTKPDLKTELDLKLIWDQNLTWNWSETRTWNWSETRTETDLRPELDLKLIWDQN